MNPACRVEMAGQQAERKDEQEEEDGHARERLEIVEGRRPAHIGDIGDLSDANA